MMVPPLSTLKTPADDAPTVISTFTGAGGSCLGFRWAGFRPLAAVEFVPDAAGCYRRNFPGVPVIERDVREISGWELLDAAGVAEVDVLEGSPPCASWSSAGSRAAGWGRERRYSDVRQRTDDLLGEFVRLVAEVRPRVFVMENVPGLLAGAARGVYNQTVAGLMSAGYDVQARLLDASRLGVAQQRVRLIVIGVRTELVDVEAGVTAAECFPTPRPGAITVGDALGALPPPDARELADREAADFTGRAIHREWMREGDGGRSRYYMLRRARLGEPCPTVTVASGARSAAGVTHPTEPRKFTPRELLALFGFPGDYDLGDGPFDKRYERVARAVPPPLMQAVAERVALVLQRAADRVSPAI